MKDVKIVIPSHKRPTRVRTLSAVAGVSLCVEESQASIYKKCNPGVEIITHPDSIIGLAAKRAWMIKNLGSIFMLDDDITDMRRVYTESGEDAVVHPDTAHDLIQSAAYSAHQAGCYLFGFSTSPSPMTFDAQNPIQLKGFATGCAHGVLEGSKLWYNPDVVATEDYWISLLNAYHHRKMWKDTRFYFSQKETFVNRGGQAEFRNMDTEKADYELLNRTFGDAIQLRANGKAGNLKHEFQKSLKLPF